MILSTILTLLPLFGTMTAHGCGCFPYNCGLDDGVDVCHDRCTPLVVRPVDLPKPVLPTPRIVCKTVEEIPSVVPFGGHCSCHSPIVKPALVSRPPCVTCGRCIDLTSDHQVNFSHKQKICFGSVTAPRCGCGCSGGYSPINPVNCRRRYLC